MGTDDINSRLRSVVGDPEATSEALVASFLEATDDDVRRAALKHANMTDRAVESIFLKGGDAGHAAIAMCDRPRLLALWALSPREEVRALVAGNMHTPAGVLEELAEDRSERVRRAAVRQ